MDAQLPRTGPGLSWGCHDSRFVLFGAVTEDMIDDFVDALERAAVEPGVESVDLRGLDDLAPAAVDALLNWRDRYGGRLPIEADTELDLVLGADEPMP